MARVESAEQATELAVEFVRKYYFWGGKPVSAQREGTSWVVKIDVGVLNVRVGHVRLDAETGAMQEYAFPEGL